MTIPFSQTKPEDWYIASWSLLAWLETLIKSVALAAGILAFINALAIGEYVFPSGDLLSLVIILLVLALG